MDSQDLQRLKNKYDIIGNDPKLNRALETAMAVAATDLTVLITGESGVGKETIPQIIHQHSLRRGGKYVAVNCGAIPEGTINAELFGHKKGAFTGAIGERKGYFEEANGGTLFLDEIGELPKETQAMLLRVIQNGEYMKVGSSDVEKTDVRIVAATNVKLDYAVATGKFREDLYYRLTGINIRIPALRERNKDDIYLLFRKFSSDFSEKYNLTRVSLSHEAISLLTSYRWPGNIRQLKNIAENITALHSRPSVPGAERIELGFEVVSAHLPNESSELVVSAQSNPHSGMFADDEKQQIIKALLVLKREVDELKAIVHSNEWTPKDEYKSQSPNYIDLSHQKTEDETETFSIRKSNDDMIEKCLLKHGGNVKAAAEELGISERTIYRKLAKKKK